jgi:hypothetical protein
MRCAPVAVARRYVAGTSRRGATEGAWVGSRGMPPPRAYVRHGTHDELAELSSANVEDLSPVDQLVGVTEDGEQFHVKLDPSMSVDGLKAKLNQSGKAAKHLYLHADEQTWPVYEALLTEIFPASKLEVSTTMSAGVHRVPVRMKFEFGVDTYRAVAKIVFHYYLCVNRRGIRGDEFQFADIRDYIIKGGDHEKFFNVRPSTFVLPFHQVGVGRALLPSVWCHILGADDTNGEVVGALALFMGPKRLAPLETVLLSRSSSRIELPYPPDCHIYRYADGLEGRVSGVVERASLNVRFGR